MRPKGNYNNPRIPGCAGPLFWILVGIGLTVYIIGKVWEYISKTQIDWIQ